MSEVRKGIALQESPHHTSVAANRCGNTANLLRFAKAVLEFDPNPRIFVKTVSPCTMPFVNGDLVIRVIDGKRFSVGRERGAKQDPTLISKTISVGFTYLFKAVDGEIVSTNDGELTSLKLFRRLTA